MADWLSSKIGSTQTTSSANTTAKRNDWLSSVGGGESTYRQNKLVSDIKPTKVSTVSKEPEKKGLIAKAQDFFFNIGKKQQEGTLSKVFSNDNEILAKAQQDMVRRITDAQSKGQNTKIMEKNLANISQAIDPNASLFKKHSEALKQRIARGVIGFESGLIGIGANLLDIAAQRTETEIELKKKRYEDLKVNNPKMAEQYAKAWLPKEGEGTENWFLDKSNNLKKWASDLGLQDPDFTEKVVTASASMAGFTLLSLATGQNATVPYLMESMMEGASAYADNRNANRSVDESSVRGNAVLLANLVVNKYLNVFDDLWDANRTAFKISKNFFMESIQEGFQQIVSNLATDKEWDEGLLESMLVGGTLGGITTILIPGNKQIVVDTNNNTVITEEVPDGQILPPGKYDADIVLEKVTEDNLQNTKEGKELIKQVGEAKSSGIETITIGEETNIKDLNKPFNEENTRVLIDETVKGNREDYRLDSEENIKKFGQGFGDAKPTDTVIVYRAGIGDIKPGDYVTTSKARANEVYLKERPGSELLSAEVNLNDLVAGGGLKSEFILSPKVVKAVNEQISPDIEPVKQAKTGTELSDYYSSQDQEAVGQAWYEVITEMDIAEAGQRLFNEDSEFIGSISSTFPEWLPEELRSRKLFDSVMDGLSDPSNIKYPPNSQPRKQRLYDEVLSQIDSRAGTDSSDIIERIKNAGEEIRKAKQTKKVADRGTKRSQATKREQKIIEYIDSKKTIKFREDDIDTIQDLEESTITTKFLEDPQIKSLKTSSYSFLDNFSRSSKLGLKPKEQIIIKRVLDNNYLNQKKIDMAEFRRLVIGELMPLNTIKSSTYADYGSDNIDINADNTTTYIMDAPYKHGETGHFGKDFIKDISIEDVEIREIPAQEGNPRAKWAVIQKGVQLTRENVAEMTFTVANSKEEAQRWIDEHSGEYDGRLVSTKSGLFSHYRSFDVDNIAHIAEVQSDSFQHLERIDESTEIKGRLKTQEENLKQDEQFLAQQEQQLERAKARMADGKEIQEYVDRYQLSVNTAKLSLENTKSEIEVLKKRLENVDKISKEQAQFLDYKNIWHERTIREAIRTKALEGFEKIRFPTPRTIAFIEGYTSEDGGMPYEIIEANDHERLEPGDIIDYGGEKMTVVDGDEYNITVAKSDQVNIFSYNDYVDESLDSMFEDTVYEFENLEDIFGIIPDSKETAQAVIDAEKILNKYVKYRNIEKDVKKVTEIIIGEGSDIAILGERVQKFKAQIKDYKNLEKFIKTDYLAENEIVRNDLFDAEKVESIRQKFNLEGWSLSILRNAFDFNEKTDGLSDDDYYKLINKIVLENTKDNIKSVKSSLEFNELKIAKDKEHLAKEVKNIKARKAPTESEINKLKVFSKSSQEILDSLPDYLSEYNFDYGQRAILNAFANGDITDAYDFKEEWKQNELENGYDIDLEGIYKEVFMQEDGANDQKVYAVDGYTENFQQPDEYEPAVGVDEFNIEDYDQDQQVVLKFYEKQLNRYIQKLRKGNLELVEDDNGFEWWETNVLPEDRNATVAFRLKDDLAEAGIVVTDAQEQEIIDLNKKIFGDDDIRFVSQVMANNKALGAYSQKMIEILGKQANPKDTFFHEAVHKYIDVFTTKEEQFSLFEEGIQRYKTDNLNLVEEKIAEDFIKYANNKNSLKGVIAKFFQKIISRIKAFNKNTSKIEKLYEEILSGKAKKKKVSKQTKASKVAVSIEQNLNQRFENLAGFETRTVKDQSEMVANLIAKDSDKARQIVTGDEPLPTGMSSSMFIAGVERYATENNDIDLIRSLATSPLVSETSVHAQELRFLAERDKTSVLAKVQEIAGERAKIFKTTHKLSAEKAIKSEISKIKDSVKVNKYDWNAFINSIEC